MGTNSHLWGFIDERVRPLAAVEDEAALGQDRGRPAVGGVDVEPEPLALADVGDGGNRVDARGRGRADGGHHREGRPARGPVLGDGPGEGVRRPCGTRRRPGSCGSPSCPTPRTMRRLLDRRVGLLGGVHRAAAPGRRGRAGAPRARGPPRGPRPGRPGTRPRRCPGSPRTGPPGSPRSWRSQSMTTVSSSVAAGRGPPQHAVDVEGGGDHLRRGCRGRTR